ncbi:hypothetical protein [Halorhodospira halophila]|uniref:Uncharacterized protein n=1 Tax=Halorhodospira halophila (strain DSM 244 / SL1) TaxID=349124 RepID=A1WUW9_HALHL|nr:hypothetical protein [Halorhodospira halophila]ABM61481.1 hypothetical protein Hhal_0699 [Halorhodospira halophila SL1]MBK1728729.1 hypothetical protein [Halorhodospira halophila]
MRKFDWTKGALALTAGSVLAIGGGKALADLPDGAEDSDSFDVSLDVWQPIDVSVSDEADLPDTIIEGNTVDDDYTFTVGGETGEQYSYTVTHSVDEEGLDLSDEEISGSGIIGDDDIEENLEVTGDDAGDYEVTVEATANYDEL